MKFSKTLVAGLAATTLLTAAASAQVSNTGDKPFDGIYAGGEVGVDWSKMTGDVKFDRSLYYGGIAGFRRQADNDLVFGIEGSFGDTGYISGKNGVNTDYEWSANAVMGQAFGDNLLYGKVGYVSSKIDYEVTAACTTCVDNNEGGWRFGGGLEHAMGTGMNLRTGIDYTTYGDGMKSWAVKSGVVFDF